MTPSMDDKTLDIGEVVDRSGLPVSTLHLWEKRGLLHPVDRKGLRRQYAPDVLDRIAVIVVCQRSGFSLAEIAELLRPETFDDRDAGNARLEAKLIELRARRAELDAAITGLEHALACTAVSPMVCDNFRSMLGEVLPRR